MLYSSRSGNIRSYQDASDYLGTKRDRPLPGRSTRIVRLSDVMIAIRYHDTNVVTYYANGGTMLDSGGWRTVTTKDRMNHFAPRGIYISQNRGVWYVNGELYADHMTIHADGTLYGTATPEQSTEQKALDKRIVKFCKAYIRELFAGKIPQPSAGDCWYCAMKSTMGESLGDLAGPEHLTSHIDEEYYVPSLIVRAMEYSPVSMVARYALSNLWGNTGSCASWDEIGKQQLQKSLIKYMRHAFKLA